ACPGKVDAGFSERTCVNARIESAPRFRSNGMRSRRIQQEGNRMDQLPPALTNGPLEEVFPGVFFVTGMMKARLMDADWQFSRNMTVVRDGNALTLINTVRLDDAGLASLG